MKKKPFYISFGKVNYTPGAPKGLPRWIWVCDCQECAKLDWQKKTHGPFKTRREAERDAEAIISSIVESWDGTHH